jgi:hypothetical protein
MSPSWEDLFTIVHVRKLVSDMSDHSPLLLMSGDTNNNICKKREFRYDISWF